MPSQRMRRTDKKTKHYSYSTYPIVIFNHSVRISENIGWPSSSQKHRGTTQRTNSWQRTAFPLGVMSCGHDEEEAWESWDRQKDQEKVIEPVRAEWTASIVFAQKNKTLRFCIHLKRLNALTKQYSYTTQPIEECINLQSAVTIFFT